MRWVKPASVLLALAVGVVALASAGWFERQLAEWREMSVCAATPPGDRDVRAAGEVGHRWSWRLGWPPGRWTCVYRSGGKVVATRPVP